MPQKQQGDPNQNGSFRTANPFHFLHFKSSLGTAGNCQKILTYNAPIPFILRLLF
jgi:hypothetical protein